MPPAALCAGTVKHLRRFLTRDVLCVALQTPSGSVSYVAMLVVAAMLGVTLTGEWEGRILDTLIREK